jgi:hypothetical protein
MFISNRSVQVETWIGLGSASESGSESRDAALIVTCGKQQSQVSGLGTWEIRGVGCHLRCTFAYRVSCWIRANIQGAG